MNELIKKMMATAEAVAEVWAITHPDIPADTIKRACGIVLGGKVGQLLEGMKDVALNDISRVTEIRITVDWEKEIEAALSMPSQQGGMH